MSVVIAAQDRPFGVLGAHSREWRRFTEHDLHFLQAVANVLADAVARKRGEEQLERAFTRLHQMSARIATAEQEERRRIARELHDELGQTLTCLKFEWASITRHIGEQKDRPPSPELELELEAAGTLIDRTIQSARRLMTSLRPAILDDLGLFAAIEAQGRDFQARTGVECDVYISPAVKEMTLDTAVSTSIYRMVQELLTNVMRYANAAVVHVHLSEAAASCGCAWRTTASASGSAIGRSRTRMDCAASRSVPRSSRARLRSKARQAAARRSPSTFRSPALGGTLGRCDLARQPTLAFNSRTIRAVPGAASAAPVARVASTQGQRVSPRTRST
jgi:hypothetical protein